MVNELSVDKQSILRILRVLQIEVSKIPERLVCTSIYPVKQYLDLILDKYINVANESDIHILMEVIHKKNISSQVKSLIMAKVIHQLRSIDSEKSLSMNQRILEKHVFRVDW